MRNAGWQILFTPAAEVIHLGGASGAAQKACISRHFFESLDYYEWKHHGLRGLLALRCAMVVGCALRAVGWAIAAAIMPGKRAVAVSKVRLMVWLTVRQLTHWTMHQKGHRPT
jgi:GT2 family glycosyltransferase